MQSALDLFRLDNKVALVTGSASGLGAAIATALSQAGATVACHGNRRPADDTAAAIKAAGGKAHAFQADLSNTTGAEHLFQQVIDNIRPRRHPRQQRRHHPPRRRRRRRARRLATTSSRSTSPAVFQLSQLAARDMIPRGHGKIINIASLLSFQGGIRVPAYSASKGGVAQITKALANEWAPKGIQVNAIAPGYFATTNTEALQADETRNARSSNASRPAAGAKPQDLAGAALFLSSAASDYVTGTILTVDGGWMGR